MRAVPHHGPLGRIGLDPPAKLSVLRASARQYGDEAPAGAIDMVHVLARAQLGIRDVEEVRPTSNGAQCVPGLDVGAGIAGIAVAAAKRDRDPPIVCRREDEEELLEIGAVVLGEVLCTTLLQ